MILVTGATGTSGREVIRRLSEMGAAFKAMVRKATDPEALAGQGIAAVVADYRDPERLSEALAGVGRSISSARLIRRRSPTRATWWR